MGRGLLFRCWRVWYSRYGGCSLRCYYPCQKLLLAETESRKWDTCPILGSRLLYDVHAVAWAGAGPSKLCPCHASAGGESSHGTAKATHSSEHQPGHLLCPKHWERTRLTCKSLHGDAVLNPSLAVFLIRLHLAFAWMESGGKDTWNFHKDKALCCGHWPVGSWGYGQTFPQHSTIGELKEWEDGVKTPVPQECEGVLDSQGCLILVAGWGSQNTRHRAKAKVILGSTPRGVSPLYISHWWKEKSKTVIIHSSAECWESLHGSARVSRSLLLPEKKHISCIYKPIVMLTFHSLLVGVKLFLNYKCAYVYFFSLSRKCRAWQSHW